MTIQTTVRPPPQEHHTRPSTLEGPTEGRSGTFHPYRRLWASERKGLPDVDVAHVAGWKDTRAMKVSYQQADPATVLRVVELEG